MTKNPNDPGKRRVDLNHQCVDKDRRPGLQNWQKSKAKIYDKAGQNGVHSEILLKAKLVSL